MSARFRRLPLIVLSAALLAAATARAQEAAKPVDNKAAAKEHYNKGTSFYDLGKYDDAIREFEAAYQLKNDPAFLYNLAQSYRQAGNHERAVHFYKTYLRYVPKAANRADIEDKIKSEEQLVAKGSGTTPPPVTTTPPVTTLPPPTNTPPPPGGQPTVTVPPPDTTLPPPSTMPNPYAPPPPAAAASGPSDAGRKFRIAGIASAGVGALMMVLGIYEYTQASSASDDIEAAARNNDAFDPAVQDRGKSAETMQWVFYGLGTLAIGAGAGLWFYGQHVTATETTTWRVSLAPTIAPNHGGATLRISF